MSKNETSDILDSVARVLIGLGIYFLVRFIIAKILGSRKANVTNSNNNSNENSETSTTWFVVGHLNLGKKNLPKAIESFEKSLMMAKDDREKCNAHNGLGKAYYTMTDYDKAIYNYNKSLELCESEKNENYQHLSLCYEGMKKYKEALVNMYLHDFYRNNKEDEKVNKDVKMKIESILEEYARERSNKLNYSRFLPASLTNCQDFFDTFVGIIPKGENDVEDVAYFLEHHQYNKLYNFFLGYESEALKIKFKEKYKSEDLFTYEIIFSSIYYIMGNTEKCVEILNNPQSNLEVIFKEFFKPPFDKVNDKFNKLDYKEIENPTVRFWLAKVYRKTGKNKLYLEIMNSIKNDHYFVYCDLLDFFMKNKQDKELAECEKEALSKFKDSSSVILCIFDYHLNIKNKEKLEEIIKELKTNDSRSFMMRGQYFGLIEDHDAQIECYNQAIVKDSTFYIAYIYLSECYKISNPEKYIDYLNQSLKVAPTTNDLIWSYKQLLSEESKRDAKEKMNK